MNNLLQSLRKLAQPKTIYAFTTMVIVVVLFTLTLDASVYYELSQYKMNYENVTNISVQSYTEPTPYNSNIFKHNFQHLNMFEAQVNNSVIKVISKSLEIGTSEPIIVYYNEMLDIYIDESTRLLKRSFKTIYEFSLTMMYILIVCGTFGIAAIFIFIKGWGCKEPPQREYSDMDIK